MNEIKRKLLTLEPTRMRWKNDQARTRSQKGNNNCETTQLQATSSPHLVEDIFALLLRRGWSQPLAVNKCSEFSARPSLKCCWSSAAILSKVRRLTFFVIKSAGLLSPLHIGVLEFSSLIFLLTPEGPNLDVSHLPPSSSLRNPQHCTRVGKNNALHGQSPFRCQLGHADHLTTHLDHCHLLGFSWRTTS